MQWLQNAIATAASEQTIAMITAELSATTVQRYEQRSL